MSKKKYFYPLCVGIYFTVALAVALFAGTKFKNKVTVPVNITTPIIAESVAPAPIVSAQACVLIDAKSGAVLYEKNSSARLPMASTTKIMTALVVLEHMSCEQEVIVSKESTLIEGSSIYLKENEKITVENLLYGLLLESGNDAAYTLALACSGSVENFTLLMNEYAKQMGLKDTNFSNPHGLSDENHFTTAYELAFITSTAMKNEKFRKIVSTKKYVCSSQDGSYNRYFFNHNKLLKSYNGAIGVKTGYTKAAGRCLVSAAQRNDEMFIVVTLNDPNDWRDHENLLEYGFENFKCVEIAPCKGLRFYDDDGEKYTNKEGVYLTVTKDIQGEFSYVASLDKNKKMGRVKYFSEDTELGRFYVFAE